jgi:hypothetical protein
MRMTSGPFLFSGREEHTKILQERTAMIDRKIAGLKPGNNP